MKLDIGILVTGEPPAELASRYAGYGSMIGALLAAREPALECTQYAVRDDHFPRDIDDHDAYVISGSRHAAYEDLPWIERLADFVRELVRRRKPLVGICFGHQLIARALGGEVRKAAQGWGVGVHRARLVANMPWACEPERGEFALVVSHQDQVISLPPGAELLASSEFCPVSMFRIDNHVFAMQGHPEFTREYSRELMDVRRSLIGDGLVGQGMASLAQEVDAARIADWILAFLQRARSAADERAG